MKNLILAATLIMTSSIGFAAEGNLTGGGTVGSDSIVANGNFKDTWIRRMVKSIQSAGSTQATPRNTYMEVIFKGTLSQLDSNETQECGLNLTYNYGVLFRYDKNYKEDPALKEELVITATKDSRTFAQYNYNSFHPGLFPMKASSMTYNSYNNTLSTRIQFAGDSAGIGDVIGSMIGIPYRSRNSTDISVTLYLNDNNYVRAYEVVDNKNANTLYTCDLETRPFDARGVMTLDNGNTWNADYALDASTGVFGPWKRSGE